MSLYIQYIFISLQAMSSLTDDAFFLPFLLCSKNLIHTYVSVTVQIFNKENQFYHCPGVAFITLLKVIVL